MATSAADPGPGRRVGILGGSFNPPHTGHLVLAAQAWWQLGLERVLLVPAGAPPHKVIDDDVPASTRLALTAAAVGQDSRFAVDDTEIASGLRYTVETLTAISRTWPGAELWFLVGSDSLLAFDTWKEPRRILGLCRLAVALRPGDDVSCVTAAAADHGKAVVLDMPPLGISSTDVRRRVRAGAPVTGLVPAAVERLITELSLYRDGPAVAHR
jgi:nicotinate-nucleotide adenylyltransferase